MQHKHQIGILPKYSNGVVPSYPSILVTIEPTSKAGICLSISPVGVIITVSPVLPSCKKYL